MNEISVGMGSSKRVVALVLRDSTSRAVIQAACNRFHTTGIQIFVAMRMSFMQLYCEFHATAVRAYCNCRTRFM